MRSIALALLLALPCSAQEVRFNRDVRPILSDKCFTCHGPDEGARSSPLRFDSQEGANVELASGGKAIVPGDPEASKLIERVASDDPVLRMPPAYAGHAKLSEDEIATLRGWIEQGAEWEGHWAFLTPEKPQVPNDEPAIDYFVHRRLEREGLAPSSEADRATLIRRATLDLTGLPPTPAEVDAFLADRAPHAYDDLVDRLLASPRYGERMAYRWLDAARYADTNGYQNDEERDMWRWRDWVIEAFNENLPYDKFTLWQIAGDLLPKTTTEQILATGFNRNHRGNGELGIVPEEYDVEYVVDRVETTATVFLGLTMGCARCHDHKYDPLTQKEFYQFYAYFNNVPDRGRYFKYGNTPPVVRAPTPEQLREFESISLERQRYEATMTLTWRGVENAIDKWQPSKGFQWSFVERLVASRDFESDAAEFDGSRSEELGDLANFDFFDPFTLSAWIRPDGPTGGIITRMKPAASARGNKGYGLYIIAGKLHFRIESTDIDDRMRVETVDSLPLGEWRHVAMTYDGRRLASGIRLYVDGKLQDVRVIIDHSNNNTKSSEPLRIGHGPGPEDRFEGAIDDVRVFDRRLRQKQISVVATAQSPAEIAAIPRAERSVGQSLKLRWAFLETAAAPMAAKAWKELRAQDLKREKLIASFPTVMVMGERKEPRVTHVLERGVYDAPGEVVEPGVPSALGSVAAGAPKTRLALARWLIDPDNPLTARVAVNRFWQMLFGTGIVSTVEDFGSQGEWPSHPELLDWLAVELIESGWDVKALMKTIVTSATYKQSSAATPELLEADPENRLLSRGPRVRLPAETIRDQALAVAGLLHEQLGGPSVKPYQPAGLWTELSNWKAYKHDEGESLYRRSLYTFWKRTIAPPAMVAFDAAPRETCIVRETRTNTPLQALDLMNDVTYVEAARKLAERMIREGGAEPAQRLAYGFKLATAREPEAREQEILLRGFQRYLDRYQTRTADAEKLLSAGESPRDSAKPLPELAAYAAVSSMILNLDEAITKE